MRALAVDAPLAYDRASGWELVRSVEKWLFMLRKFQELAGQALATLRSGTFDERDAVAARFANTVTNIERAMPHDAFPEDVHGEIARAIVDAREANEPALRLRLEQLQKEVAEVEDWLTAQVATVGQAAVSVGASA